MHSLNKKDTIDTCCGRVAVLKLRGSSSCQDSTLLMRSAKLRNSSKNPLSVPAFALRKREQEWNAVIYEPARQKEVMTGRKSTMRKQIGAHVRGRENDCFSVRLSARGSHKTSGTIEISPISRISLSLMFLPISCVICSRTASNSGVLTLCPGSSRSVTTRSCILGRWEEQSFFFRSITFLFGVVGPF